MKAVCELIHLMPTRYCTMIEVKPSLCEGFSFNLGFIAVSNTCDIETWLQSKCELQSSAYSLCSSHNSWKWLSRGLVWPNPWISRAHWRRDCWFTFCPTNQLTTDLSFVLSITFNCSCTVRFPKLTLSSSPKKWGFHMLKPQLKQEITLTRYWFLFVAWLDKFLILHQFI